MQSQNILISGFRPFDGRSVNGAETLARSMIGEQFHHHQVQVCLLRVCWRGVESFVQHTLAASQHSLYIAIGEADRTQVCVEFHAHGRCEGTDVGGHTPPAAMSTNSTPLRSRLDFDAAWFASHDATVTASNDAGAYLCNRLLYLGLRHSNLKLGFVHVPVQGTQSNHVYLQRYRPAIVTLIENNLTETAYDKRNWA